MTEAQRWEAWRLRMAARCGRHDPQAETVLRLIDAFCVPSSPSWDGFWARRPTCGENDGIYFLTWAFNDRPDQTFVIEVQPDGWLEWFFRDRAAGVTDGTDDDHVVDWLPPRAVEYLMRHFSEWTRAA